MANLKEDVTNTVWSALEGIANFFGMGPLVSNFAKSVGYTTDSASLTKVINKMVESGKLKSAKELDDLQNRLASIPEIKSNLTASVIYKARDELRDKIQKKSAQISKADTALNSALNRAANLDYLTVGQKNSAQNSALEEASEASKLYEKEI